MHRPSTSDSRVQPRLAAAGHLRTGLAMLIAVAASAALGLMATAQEWDDDRYASRPEAAEPASQPWLGPPIGGAWPPSTVIYPPQDIPYRFFHDKHVEIGMSCTACHGQAETSVNSADRMLPAMQVCLDCHTLEDGVDAMPPADCTTCHLNYVDDPARFPDTVDEVNEDTFELVLNPPPRVDIPAPAIIFPHKDHVDAGIECADCHGTMEEVQLATRYTLPTMDHCLDCHTGRDEEPSDDCTTCHLAEPGGARMLTHLPTGILMPTGRFRNDDHRFDYLDTHRNTAASDIQYCYNCHTESYCEDCHNGVMKPMAIHPPGYVQLHAIDAYQDDSDCQSCHTTQDFCIDCHSDVGLTLAEAASPDGGRFRFHPDGWVRAIGGEMGTGLQSEHAVAAQRNMGACVSCHSESDCIACHSTQSVRVGAPVNPHPANWLDTCGAALERNMTPCLKCHLVDDPMLGMCR